MKKVLLMLCTHPSSSSLVLQTESPSESRESALVISSLCPGDFPINASSETS